MCACVKSIPTQTPFTRKRPIHQVTQPTTIICANIISTIQNRRAQTSVESNISGIVLTNETTAIYHSSFNGDITSQDTVRVSTRVQGLPGIVVRSGTDGCVDGGEVDCHYIPGKYSGLGAIKTVCGHACV